MKREKGTKRENKKKRTWRRKMDETERERGKEKET
jgi:hypothetical protein